MGPRPSVHTIEQRMAERIYDFLGAQYPLKAVPGFYGPRPGIRERESLAPPQQSPQATRSLQRRANIRSCRFCSAATPGHRAPRATLWL